jgi:hypothetical protein
MTRHMENLAQENRDLTERMKDLAQETSLVTKKLQELQQNTVDDSAIVKIITLVSAVYLPGSFVGVRPSFLSPSFQHFFLRADIILNL